MRKVLDYIKKEKKFFLFLLGVILLFVVDIVSKWIVEKNCALYEKITLIPNFLYITKSYNVAIAFSLGEQLGVAGRVINISISVIMSVIIMVVWALKKSKFRTREHVIAMLLFSGAVGNLIDRAFYWEGTTGFNGVIDFIQFYLGGGPNATVNFVNPFATFNFADSFLVIGIIVFIVVILIDNFKTMKAKAGTADDLSVDPREIDEQKKEEEEEENQEEEA